MTRGLGRWIAAFGLAVTLGGCATTAGDGSVVDDWGVMASATPKVPSSGVCYAAYDGFAGRVGTLVTDPIPCTTAHGVETFHVGEFPADVTLQPRGGEASYWRAFEECERKAKDFLGDDWYNGRLFLNLAVPIDRQWDGGARWYRCELIETRSMYIDLIARREVTLAGVLQGPAPLALRCADIVGLQPDHTWEDLKQVDCASPHDVEFAGVFKVHGVDPPDEKQRESIPDGCTDVLVKYLGGTRNGIQVGLLAWGLRPEDWKRGDRWVRCYALHERKKVGSVKGIGNRPPRG